MSRDDLGSLVPGEHKAFAASVLAQHDIDTAGLYEEKSRGSGGFLGEGRAANILDIAFAHPISMIVNALGVPPAYMLELGKAKGAGRRMVGSKQHAVKQAEAGVDILIVSGTEAGGHCGEVSTMVLVPEVAEAVAEFDGVSILAAGGIVTGRQMAAAMAMGAHGAWCGSVWLTTQEAETAPVIKEKLLAASSNQTVRSKSRTGKYSRQIRSPWTDAWESSDAAPDPLPMPLQSHVSEPALSKVAKLAETGHQGARQLATYWVGQGVGMMTQSLSARQGVYDFMEDFLKASERLNGVVDEA